MSHSFALMPQAAISPHFSSHRQPHLLSSLLCMTEADDDCEQKATATSTTEGLARAESNHTASVPPHSERHRETIAKNTFTTTDEKHSRVKPRQACTRSRSFYTSEFYCKYMDQLTHCRAPSYRQSIAQWCTTASLNPQ